jgi:hypothetical protein
VLHCHQLLRTALSTFRIRFESRSPLLRFVIEHPARACHQSLRIRRDAGVVHEHQVVRRQSAV